MEAIIISLLLFFSNADFALGYDNLDQSNQNTQNGQGVTQFAADPVATKAGAENTSQCCARQWGQRYSQQRRCGKGLTHCV